MDPKGWNKPSSAGVLLHLKRIPTENPIVTYDNYWGLCVDEWGVFHWDEHFGAFERIYLDPKIIDKWNDRIDTIMLKNVVPA